MEGLNLYGAVAKQWIIKATKHPLVSILTDPGLDLDFFSPDTHPAEA